MIRIKWFLYDVRIRIYITLTRGSAVYKRWLTWPPQIIRYDMLEILSAIAPCDTPFFDAMCNMGKTDQIYTWKDIPILEEEK